MSILQVKNLVKEYKIYNRPVDRLKEILFRKTLHINHRVINDISFTLGEGEFLSIIGPNGAGKSTLLKLIMGTLLPDRGFIIRNGRITGLLELGTGFDFNATGIENIYFNGILLGMQKNEIDKKLSSIIEFAELGDFIDKPLKTYSTGMVMRLAFSIAMHADPKCFIIDEALSVGDIYFQQKCFKKLKEIKEKGVSILFVSHDLGAVRELSDRAILLHKGRILHAGDTDAVIKAYMALIGDIGAEEFEEQRNYGHFCYGTKDVIIEEVSIRSNLGNNTVVCGESFQLVLTIHAKSDVNNLTLGFLIKDRFGREIFGTNTFLLGQQIRLRKGNRKYIIFELPANFAPGVYTITVAAHDGRDHTERCFHWIDGAAELKILGDKNREFVGLCYVPVQLKLNFEC